MRYFLKEYGASALVRELSYEAFNFVKKAIEKEKSDVKEIYFDVDDQEIRGIFFVSPSQYTPKNKSYHVSGKAAYSTDDSSEEVLTMIIDVLYNPDRFSPKDFSELHNDLKSTIAHELEHIYYYLKKRESLYKAFFKDIKKYYHHTVKHSRQERMENPTIYFLEDVEIPAFVRTIYTTAKKKRIPFKEALNAWLDALESSGWNMTPEDRKLIYDTYLKVAQKMFPNIKKQ